MALQDIGEWEATGREGNSRKMWENTTEISGFCLLIVSNKHGKQVLGDN